MGFWNWFKGNSKAKKDARGRHSKPLDPKITQAFGRVKRDIRKLRRDLTEANSKLDSNTQMIAENTRSIHSHTSRLDKLEEIVITAPKILPDQSMREDYPTNRPNEPTNRLVATKLADADPAGKMDMSSLSGQEKRIMGVFLAHRDMALCYQDVAKYLGKSPHTIKNQMRQMNMKASLFEKSVDGKNMNRFKLKKHLRIETDLDMD